MQKDFSEFNLNTLKFVSALFFLENRNFVLQSQQFHIDIKFGGIYNIIMEGLLWRKDR